MNNHRPGPLDKYRPGPLYPKKEHAGVNLIIDIGNTQMKAAAFDEGRLVDHIRFDNQEVDQLQEWTGRFTFSGAILCHVGRKDTTLPETISRDCRTVIRLNQETPLPFEVLYRSKESLGYDRIAAAAGAFHAFPGTDVMILDFGTAITIDFMAARGAYLGGNISPGMNIRFKALHDYTAGLPFVEKDAKFPRFGDDTRTAIVAGVQQGIGHEITGYVRSFTEKHASGRIIATGGDAAFYAPFLPQHATLDPELVLKGLNAILAYNSR